MRETNSVGAIRVVEMLLGEDQAARLSRPVLRLSGFLFMGFVFLSVWLPSRETSTGSLVLLWIVTYTVYLLFLEILSRKAKRWYESMPFRLFRIQFNLVMIALLIFLAPPIASGYLWFFFSWPLLATLVYFGRFLPLWIIYLEVCTSILVLTFAQGWPTSPEFAAMVAKGAILGLLAAVFCFLGRLFPRLREENTLLKAANMLVQIFDSSELGQLLADAAKVGVPIADAAVVHLLKGKVNRTLVPTGSSHVDLSALGRSLMEIGVGIAGHAIESRETINVPDVDKDDRYHRLPSSFIPFKSLLVAPMYVGRKNVGTISVHSARRGAFGEQDERFLTMLAAQGAMSIANAELFGIRTRRRQQISDILEASLTFGLNQPLDVLLQTIAVAVCRCSGYRMAVVNLLDEASGEVVVKTMAGVPPAGRRKLEGMHIPLDVVKSLLQDEFRISRSYFIRHDRRPKIPGLGRYTFTVNLDERKPGEWHQEDMLIVPVWTQEERLLGYISVDDPDDRQLPSLDTVQALEVLASVAATAIENARLFRETQQRVAELEALRHTSLKVTSSLDLSTVLDSIVESALNLVGATDCDIFLFDEASGTFTFGAALWKNGRREAVVRVPCHDSLTATVAQEGRPIVIDDAAHHSLLATPEVQEWGVQAIAGFPLKRAGRVLGTLTSAFLEPHTFSQEELRVLGLLADQAAIAIENARLYKNAQQRANELGALREIGDRVTSTLDLDQVLVIAMEEIRCLLDVVGCSVWLIDPEANVLVCRQATGPKGQSVRGVRLAPGEGLADWVACHGESLIVSDAQADERHFKGVDQATSLELRSILTAPLRVKQEVIGVLQVVDTEIDRFKVTDLPLVESLAATVAIAIENARLYEETDRLRAFNENIVQSMEEGILLEDASAYIAFVNRRTAELLGYASEELMGQHCTAIVAPEEVAKVEEEIAKRPQGIASRYETVLLTKEGHRVPIIVSATPLFFEEGSFTGVLSVYTDLTDIKRQETRLRDYLSTVTSSLAQHTSLEGLYEFIVEVGARFLSARDCALFLVSDKNRDVLELVSAVASPFCGDGSSISIAISTDPGLGLVVHVVETCQPIRLVGEEIFQHPSWDQELWTKMGWGFDLEANHSLLATPMCLPDGHLVGVLMARDAESQEGFSEFDEVLLKTLATNAAADIERVKGLEKAHEDAVRAERTRLETDLHEAMNVLATGVRWESEILSDQLSYSDLGAAGTTLERLQAALARAYTDLRYLLEDLRDPTLEQQGLLVALKKQAELIGRGYIVVYGDYWERLPPKIEGIFYRVGQEVMSNAVKHSGVVRDRDVKIEVWLERRDGQAKLWVKDNGVGFDVESALSRRWGLRRLRDTLREMGGNLDIDSTLGQGATICATIALTTRSAAQ